MLHAVPFEATLFALTMVSFVTLRKLGQAHWLMPHQGTVGIGVGLTIAGSVARVAGFLPVWLYPTTVFFPQQMLFIAALLTRKESSSSQIAIVSVAVTILVAAITSGSPAWAFLATILVTFGSSLFSQQARLRAMMVLWALLGAAHCAAQPAVLAVAAVTVQELTLLNVKLAWATVEDATKDEDVTGKAKRANKWTW